MTMMMMLLGGNGSGVNDDDRGNGGNGDDASGSNQDGNDDGGNDDSGNDEELDSSTREEANDEKAIVMHKGGSSSPNDVEDLDLEENQDNDDTYVDYIDFAAETEIAQNEQTDKQIDTEETVVVEDVDLVTDSETAVIEGAEKVTEAEKENDVVEGIDQAEEGVAAVNVIDDIVVENKELDEAEKPVDEVVIERDEATTNNYISSMGVCFDYNWLNEADEIVQDQVTTEGSLV